MTIKGLHFVILQNRSKIEFCFTPGVSCPGESVFLQLKFEYLGQNETKYENMLTHWSVAQAGSNDEKMMLTSYIVVRRVIQIVIKVIQIVMQMVIKLIKQ